ncbi:hypothetical protein B296_00055902 [Ensete ventricosum]|uniref:Protein kinase domain-containing protein n=1 Tax=Ensete ventricosum TaxID=4639 RepID=A0A426X0Z7_ENSVE|nr:hypothetical protein B296_00055902 [Ensete ventricosum]
MLLKVMIKLVGLLLYLTKPATAACEAKSCGRVTNISHPFWLRDPQQPPSGFRHTSFELSCEDGLPILVSSYNSSYYLYDIFYGNKSFWVRNKNFDDEGCAIPYYDMREDSPFSSELARTSRAPVLLWDGGREKSGGEDIERLLKNGFLVEWGDVDACRECIVSNGRCRVVGLLLAFAAIFLYVRERPKPWHRSRNTREGHGHDFLEKHESLAPDRYKTSHVNVVTLLGFCQEGQRRALVYEYMPNGSLEKYIYSDPPETSLPWDKLYQIAIGIARVLQYLHHGCNTRIVHFDIKPHNILLDSAFYGACQVNVFCL